MAGSSRFPTELEPAQAGEPQPVRAVRLGVVAGAMMARPASFAAEPPAPASPTATAPGPASSGLLRVLRAALHPVLIRFEYRVRTAVDRTSAASAIARAERDLVEQRAILQAIETRIALLADDVARLQQELAGRRGAPPVPPGGNGSGDPG